MPQLQQAPQPNAWCKSPCCTHLLGCRLHHCCVAVRSDIALLLPQTHTTHQPVQHPTVQSRQHTNECRPQHSRASRVAACSSVHRRVSHCVLRGSDCLQLTADDVVDRWCDMLTHFRIPWQPRVKRKTHCVLTRLRSTGRRSFGSQNNHPDHHA